MIWQVPEGELEWPSPPSFVLPPLPTPSTRPPPPPYLGLPKDTGHGASALTNRPVDYPSLYTRTHQDPLPLTSFPSSLALNTATTASETVHLTDLTQVKSCQLKQQQDCFQVRRTANLALLPRHSLLPRARLTRPLPLLPSLPKPQMQVFAMQHATVHHRWWFYRNAQARFERDYMSLAECKHGESGRVELKTGIANHHG